MKVTTNRLIIRPFMDKDLNESHRLFMLNDAMKFLGLAPAFTDIAQSKARLDEWMGDGLHHAITLKDGSFIGYITIDPDSDEDREDTKELGFALLPEYRGNGYMKEAVLAAIDQLKQDNIRYVWACCFEGNQNSENLIKSCGFTLINNGTFYVSSEDCEYNSMEYRIDLEENV